MTNGCIFSHLIPWCFLYQNKYTHIIIHTPFNSFFVFNIEFSLIIWQKYLNLKFHQGIWIHHFLQMRKRLSAQVAESITQGNVFKNNKNIQQTDNENTQQPNNENIQQEKDENIQQKKADESLEINVHELHQAIYSSMKELVNDTFSGTAATIEQLGNVTGEVSKFGIALESRTCKAEIFIFSIFFPKKLFCVQVDCKIISLKKNTFV